MGFGFFCIGTIILSIVLDFKNGFRLYKDIADAGYKIDAKRYSEIQKELYPDATKVNFLSLCIPFYNFFYVLKKVMEYNNSREMIVDQLNSFGVLEEMTDLEKKHYEKNPTGFNAVYGSIALEVKLMNSLKMEINDEEMKGTVYYKYGKTIRDIKVVETTIDTKKFSLEEQAKKVLAINDEKFEKALEAMALESRAARMAQEEREQAAAIDKEEIAKELEEVADQDKYVKAIIEATKEVVSEDEETKEEEPVKTFTKKL